MEPLENIKPRVLQIGCKVNEDEMAEIKALLAKKNWKLGAFVRVAIKKELTRLKK